MHVPDTDSPLRTVMAVCLLIFTVPLLMMSLMMFLMGGAMGPMGGSAFFAVPPLLLAIGVGYAGYTLLPSDTDRGEESTDDPIERIQEQYTGGHLTEAELERQLERQLDEDGSVEPMDEPGADTTGTSETEFEG